ncbi:HEAT repeat domain-containing protein [Aquirhabdus parva]|uniref:HEAT repeat domain-containing protein n=1 Tax=Aquirhabdus parva TaxID=2283318 RepID=A0A345PAK6_9GAMM|nr:HEAT repeat domain-containing protein [Aquirhabdus parva]AXI04315.1 HEAT repeat domain-containing protein [Aquirhabdus parva]
MSEPLDRLHDQTQNDWIDEELAEIRQRLSDEDAGIRRIALLDLAELDDEQTIPWYLHALRHDPASEVRQEAARLLAAWETDPVVSALCHALTDDSETVRELAAQSLSEFKLHISGRIILPWADHTETYVRIAALRALRELRLPESFATAQNNLSHPSPAVRREAVGVLGWLKHTDALPRLAEIANQDEHAEVRRIATGALGYAQDSSVLPALLHALRDDIWQVREEAAHTLGKLRLQGATNALISALSDEYWQVRIHAARSLGKLKAPAATIPLLTTLEHSISNLRKEAALALGEIGNEQAKSGLEIALSDGDPEVRKAVRIALSQLNLQASTQS